MMPVPHYLRDLKITRVDLVPGGANIDETGDGSHVMLWKSASGKDDDSTLKQLLEKLTSFLKKEPGKMAETKKLADMNPEELLKHSEEQAKKLTEAAEATTKLQGEHDGLKKGFDELTEKVVALTKAPPAATPEELKKAEELKKLEALPADVQAVLKAQAEVADARIAKAEERATEAEKIAKAEQEARIVKESQDAAQKLQGIPGSVEEVGKLLRDVASLPEEASKAVRKTLETMSGQLLQSPLFKALGRRSEEDETPMGQLRKVAQEILKSDTKLTPEQALAQATVDNPELAEKARAET